MTWLPLLIGTSVQVEYEIAKLAYNPTYGQEKTRHSVGTGSDRYYQGIQRVRRYTKLAGGAFVNIKGRWAASLYDHSPLS